jgi:L-alanine-DL-glutamate epimerase-like enolase superfamily enzyme
LQLLIHEFDLPLRHPFTTSRGTTAVQQTLVVELVEAGQHGYGEATANQYFGVTIDAMRRALEPLRPELEPLTLSDPSEFWNRFAPRLSHHPFAQCALDVAANDLWGKLQGQPVYRLWGLEPTNLPTSSFTIGIDSIDTMVAKLRDKPGWPIYKIKLGMVDDVAIVRELRRHTDAPFRVDANCGWTVDETLRNAEALRPLGVEFIEQPLLADDWAGSRLLFEKSPLPIIADESCVAEEDVERCAGSFHGVNIKLMKCGGLTPARQMIARAHELGLSVMVGCMTESTVGISAIAQLLPMLDFVDMDGAALLAEDIATGVRVDRGRCIFPSESGTGAILIVQS